MKSGSRVVAGKKNGSRNEIGESLVDVLYWRTARRADATLARVLYERGEIEGLYSLEETGLLDDYFFYLKQIGALQKIGRVSPEEGKRFMVPYGQILCTYLSKTVCGIRSMNALPDLLLTHEGSMRLLGFNARQIESGICRRGEAQRKYERRGGPMCQEMIANQIAKLGPRTVEKLFNSGIRCLARSGVFPKEITASLDATDIRTSDKFPGCGCTTRKKSIRVKGKGLRTVEIIVYGWKVWALMETTRNIPLAVKIDRIEVWDGTYTKELIERAEKNLGKWARLKTVVLDRGFLEGGTLWWIAAVKGLYFVIPAKSNMRVAAEARKMVHSKQIKDKQIAERTETIVHGRGTTRREIDRLTRVIGITGLTSYDTYIESDRKATRNRKSFVPGKIQAVVVTSWRGHAHTKGKEPVFLTNGSVKDPFESFDLYDQRSLIENGLWRNSKQYWSLKHPPQRNLKALTSHVFLTMLMMACVVGYRRWADHQANRLEKGQTVGIQRYWRKLMRENIDRVILFQEDTYGIFYLSEVLTLTGINVRMPHPNARTREQLIAAYNLA